jgi:hypothetical protein
MARVRNLQLSESQAYLDPIRDVFLFCCFSGLRHSDANNLRRSDIKGDHIEVTTVKTADSISIELNDVTKAILEKYKDAPFNDNKALPNYTNQAMNRDVKELCKLAGINEESVSQPTRAMSGLTRSILSGNWSRGRQGTTRG